MPQFIDGGLGRMRNQVADAVGMSIGATKQAARRAGDAADDMLHRTSRSIKRHPARAVLTSAGIAFAAGMLVGRAIRRR